MSNETGYFILSLDTELGLGVFDKDQARKQIFSPEGKREREAIKHLLMMFEKYDIIATWAIVGHLFYEYCEECEICPMRAWQGRFNSFEEVYKTKHPLWYGADIVEMILSNKIKHEIAFHGYSHEVFNEATMNTKKAENEIVEYLRVAKRFGITPKAIVFPRDKVDHLSLFEKYGFQSYRSEEKTSLLVRNKYFGKYLKTADHILGITTPPIYHPSEFECNGMVNLRASQHIFGFNRKVDRFLDSRSLSNLRIRRISRAIKKAAKENKVVHIWAHPWEFRSESDFEKLDYILSCVAEEIQKGRMRSVGMTKMAQIAINQ
jgi:peptidoglycan/xylan/chitin deacetylase (PgdA/CDA1 family)